MNVEKINRRAEKQGLHRQVREHLEMTVWSKGVPGRCKGARPGQLRAGAKVIVDRYLSRQRRAATA
jgi:hypothetical protein